MLQLKYVILQSLHLCFSDAIGFIGKFENHA